MGLSFSVSGFDNDSLGISVQDQLSDHPFFEVDICYDGCKLQCKGIHTLTYHH